MAYAEAREKGELRRVEYMMGRECVREARCKYLVKEAADDRTHGYRAENSSGAERAVSAGFRDSPDNGCLLRARNVPCQ